MLVMEDGDDLWLARATPRAWLAGGQRIAVKDMPTRFGAVSYEIVSDVEHGRIAATVEVPARTQAKAVLLRIRHPKAAPIKAVTVDGQPWKDFDPVKEVIRLNDVKGSVKVEATY
jgi:hypothetical protein